MSQPTHYSDPELESLINKEFAQIEADASNEAEALGNRSYPELHGDTYAVFWEPFHSRFQKLITLIEKRLQLQTTIESVKESNKNTDDNTREMENQLNDAKGIRDKSKASLVSLEIPSISMAKYKTVVFMIIAVVGFDAFMNIDSFKGWGAGVLEALSLALLLALLLGAFVHLSPKLILLGKNRLQKWGIVILLALLAGTLFMVLAQSRSNYLTELAKENGLEKQYSSIVFVVMSIFIIFIGVGLSLYLQLMKPQLDLLHKRQKLIKEVQKADSLIDRLKTSKKSAQQNHSNVRIEASSIISYASSLEAQVVAESNRIYGLFKSTNLRFRTEKPDCYNEKYPLEFQLNFSPIYQKTSFNTSITMLLIGISLGLTSCETSEQPTDTEIILVIDETSPSYLHPQGSEIMHLSGLENDIYKSVRVEITTIGDYDNTSSKIFELPTSSKLWGDNAVRKAQVHRFEAEVATTVDSIVDGNGTAQHSIVHKKIADVLQRLAKSPSTNKFLIMHSDFMQHDPHTISFYDTTILKKLDQNPQEVRRLLEKEGKLPPSLTGINIYLLFQSTFETNLRYRTLSSFYSTWFKELGAKTYIGSTLE